MSAVNGGGQIMQERVVALCTVSGMRCTL